MSHRKASSHRSSTRSPRSLAQIKSTAGTSMILVEQNVEFLAALADRVLIIYRGRIVAELPGSEITMHTMDQHVM